jgi:hypothetical protein
MGWAIKKKKKNLFWIKYRFQSVDTKLLSENAGGKNNAKNKREITAHIMLDKSLSSTT